MVYPRRNAAEERILRPAVAAVAKGAYMGLRVPRLRNYVFDKLAQRLNTTYVENNRDDDVLMNVRWFGRRLKPFFNRLIEERPGAAQAIIRFLLTWMRDIYRRKDLEEAGSCAPSTVVIEPTDRCNLSCPGCYAKSSCDGSDLPYDDMVQIIEQVTAMGVSLITISGGEPFLREKVDQTLTRLARRYSNQGFLIYTNGTLIDEQIAAKMGKLGNMFPAISVEGFEHQTDARRGKGTYEINRRVRKMLADAGVMTGFSATITSENAEAVADDEFIDKRIEEGDLFGWFFLLQPIGRSPRTDLMPNAEQRAMTREAIYRWRSQERPIFLGDFWNDGHLAGGCMAGGRYYFHIYANGDISPCVFAPVTCGNIFNIIRGESEYESLDDFVQRNPVFKAFREEQTHITDRNRPCLLIDHPDAIRRISKLEACRPARNMTDGYLDGRIAAAIDELAKQWEERAKTLPPLPAAVEKQQQEQKQQAKAQAEQMEAG